MVCRSRIHCGCSQSFVVLVSMVYIQCLHLSGRFSTVLSLLSLVMSSRAVFDVPAKSICSSMRKPHSTSSCWPHVGVHVLVASFVGFGVVMSMCPSFCSKVVLALRVSFVVLRVLCPLSESS